MKLRLNIDEDLSPEDGLLYMMLGDMFDVDVEVYETSVVARGKSRDVWSWLAFHLLEWEDFEA